MKKSLLSAAFVVAAIFGVEAQSVTWTQDQIDDTVNGVTLGDSNGYNIFQGGQLEGTLTAVEITATKVSGTTPAGELSIYITPTAAFQAGGLLYVGGSNNTTLNASQWYTWPNNDGTTISGMVTLTTPITLTSTNVIRLANLYLQETEATWDNVTVTLYGVSVAGPTDYCITYAAGPYTNFNTLFGGAPTNEGDTNEITTFEAWGSEAYTIDNFVEGNEYTFSLCNGPGAGSWIPDFTILSPSGEVVTYGVDTDGCSITWTATESGTYIVVINEEGNCGTPNEIDNGFPAITNNGVASVYEITKSTFIIYPNPANNVINISAAEAIEKATITDLNGRIVKDVTLGVNEAQINISDLSRGVYILNAVSNGKTVTEKIIKN